MSDNEPDKPASDQPPKPVRPCPICGKMSLAGFFPFCSKRCKQVDLNRWFTGHYAIPVVETDEDDDFEEPKRR